MPRRVPVQRQGRAIGNVFGFLAVPFQQHISLADGIGFRVDFLTKQVDRNFFPLFSRQFQETRLGHCEHPAGPAGSVIAGISRIFNLVFYGVESQISHEFDDIAWRPVFPGFFVVFFIETADEFLENGPHAMIIQSR